MKEKKKESAHRLMVFVIGVVRLVHTHKHTRTQIAQNERNQNTN